MSTKPILFFLAATLAFAQLPPAADWAAHAQNEYQVFPNITYLTASGYESKLDVYQRRDMAIASDADLLSRRRLDTRH